MARTWQARATRRAPIQGGPSGDAWREFVQLYGPVIYTFAKARGLEDVDATDLMREVLQRVARNEGTRGYDSTRGTVHAWLLGVTCDTLAAFRSHRGNQPCDAGDRDSSTNNSASGRVPEPDADWDAAFQRRLAVQAMGFVEHEFPSSTWQAFWKAAIDGRPTHAVGSELAMTIGAVHVAKCRVLARLREEVHRLRLEAEARSEIVSRNWHPPAAPPFPTGSGLQPDCRGHPFTR